MLLEKGVFQDKDHISRVNILFSTSDFMLLQVANHKKVRIENPDFTVNSEDSWPSVYVAIWNHPEHQVIAVQKRTTAFECTRQVINLVEKSTAPQLAHNNLQLTSHPIYEPKDFWDLIHN